ncbi:MAG TPA: aminoacyl-histidine dipeptidase [Vicinamibacterales bacterium]|jgi:dipeptidase D
MSHAIEGLKPALVWKYFAEISLIPRGSKNEAAIGKYLVDAGKKLGLWATQDGVGNVLVRKPASAGRELVPSVCLQGHMDMVCEKNKDTVHDFLEDPIELVRKDNMIMANGTTLGADNGIAVATCLAIMEDRSLEHGPLEFLFTVDEETGLTGANALQPGFLESKILINLDSEDEGELYVGCSGGRDNAGTWELQCDDAPAGGKAVLVKVAGLRGGHSGLEIHQGRGNALKIINRVLTAMVEAGGRLAKVEGGNKRNAIPREAEALVWFPKAKAAAASSIVDAFNLTIKAEFASVEPGLAITCQAAKGVRKVLKKALQKKLLLTLAALPHGVLKMSADIPGLVETSSNLAIVQWTKKNISVQTSQRSSVASEIEEASQMVRAAFELGGALATGSDGYPGWKPDIASPILKLAQTTYLQLFRKEPAVKAVHAGLECGIIGEKYPGMDMVSFGPTMREVHSPNEHLYIDTVGKFWQFLLGILKAVK